MEIAVFRGRQNKARVGRLTAAGHFLSESVEVTEGGWHGLLKVVRKTVVIWSRLKSYEFIVINSDSVP